MESYSRSVVDRVGRMARNPSYLGCTCDDALRQPPESSAVPAGGSRSEPLHGAGCRQHGATAPTAGDQALPGSPQLIEIGRVTHPGRAENVRQARHFISGLLGRDWLRLDDVLTLASEVVSNAVRHTRSGDGGHFEVTVATCTAGSRVRIEVTDQGGPSVPRPGAADGDPSLFTGGRGLMIVDVLADRWGHDGDERGRVVWFEVSAKHETETTPQ